MDKEKKRMELNAFGVHDIRHLARNLGVGRPTMKLKAQLIEEILAIMGGDYSKVVNSIRGRHTSMKLASIQSSTFLIPPEIQSLIAQETQRDVRFQDDLDAIKLCQTIEADLLFYAEHEGYLQLEGRSYYFYDLKSDLMVYVHEDFVREHGLMVCDRILAKCAECPGVAFAVVKEILEANKQKITAKKRDLCPFDRFRKERKLDARVGRIHEGQVHMERESLLELDMDEVEKTLRKFLEKGFKVIFFGTSLTQAFSAKYVPDVPHEDALSYLNANPLRSVRKTQNVVFNGALRAQMGQKVLIVFLDTKRVMRDVVLCFNADNPKVEPNFFDKRRILDQITDYCRVLDNGGSLTMIMYNTKM